ncbi:MAG: hydroxymethylglutaryl-CoA reductase [Bacteroidales bacterium]|nr:hydroxymethylglutaryl-CoA reductase [Bacteroidales bacterium]
MKKQQIINGFSKLGKEQKLEVVSGYFENSGEMARELRSYWHTDPEKQKLFDEFSENTISNFYFPFGIAPNFIINGQSYLIPMVIEESSVIAAASKSAKFWAERGGFHAEVVSTIKTGQVHFIWKGCKQKLIDAMPELVNKFRNETNDITSNMRKRGGGIIDIQLVNLNDEIEHYYQINASFETVDSMGANFINSCLEEFAVILKEFFKNDARFQDEEKECDIIMAILSNYTPNCLVKATVECAVNDFSGIDKNMTAEKFVWKFQKAVEIASVDEYRATTHNKGIFNGIDSVVLATGNDFRAVEACGHTFAAKEGKYKSLSSIDVSGGHFRYELTVPLALGTVGGLTTLHPLAKFSLDLLGKPDAKELMMIAASAGLANNFGAIKSLITKGIQIGHMKMHLFNILNMFKASTEEKNLAVKHFEEKKVSFQLVSNFLDELRKH